MALGVLFIITLGLIVLAVMYIELRRAAVLLCGLALGFGLYLAGLLVFFRFLIGKIKQRLRLRGKTTIFPETGRISLELNTI